MGSLPPLLFLLQETEDQIEGSEEWRTVHRGRGLLQDDLAAQKERERLAKEKRDQEKEKQQEWDNLSKAQKKNRLRIRNRSGNGGSAGRFLTDSEESYRKRSADSAISPLTGPGKVPRTSVSQGSEFPTRNPFTTPPPTTATQPPHSPVSTANQEIDATQAPTDTQDSTAPQDQDHHEGSAANSGTAESYSQMAARRILLSIFRKDMKDHTDQDWYHIQAKVGEAQWEEYERSGSTEGYQSGSVSKKGKVVQVECGSEKCKDILKAFMEGAEAATDDNQGYIPLGPGERLPGHRIWGTVPRTFERLAKPEKLPALFSIGSGNKVPLKEVKVNRAPEWVEGSSIRMWLEVSDRALEWLKVKNWSSPIGGHIVHWKAQKIRGFRFSESRGGPV